MIIRAAKKTDAPKVLEVTHKAFLDYQRNLSANSPTTQALKETESDVLGDIVNNHVYVAEEGGEILGTIRYMMLQDDLAYIYRFGVMPDIKNTGVGSELLAHVIELCNKNKVKAIALHTNSKYFKLARYYYGREFYVHSTTTDRGYIRALFIKELVQDCEVDLTKAMEH